VRKFKQLSIEERERLYVAKISGKLIRKMASELGTSPSTISRKIMRNTQSTELGYLPDIANISAKARRNISAPKFERWPELKEYVIKN
jgi:IS30 family transposase